MANRNFYQFFYALENDPVFLWVKWKASNSAVSSAQSITYGNGVSSINKTATGKLSPNQLEWMRRLQQAGHMAIVCRTFEERKRIIEMYMKNICKPYGEL